MKKHQVVWPCNCGGKSATGIAWPRPLTNTALHSEINAGSPGGAVMDGTISGVDEMLNHFLVTCTNVTNTGGFVAYEKPGDFVSVLYEVTDTTLTGVTGAINDPAFPTEPGGNALTFTRAQ